MVRTSRRAIAGLVVIGAVVAGVLVSPAATAAAVASIAADPLLFGLVVAGLYLVRPLFAWPTTPLAAVAGYGFGVALGVPIALVGVVATVIPVFLAVTWVTIDADGAAAKTGPTTDSGRLSTAIAGPVERLFERTGTAIDRYYETAGPVRGVVASRLAPIPSDVATAAAAIADVRLRQLVVGTAIGELPWTIAAVVVGASAATLSTDGLAGTSVALAIGCAVAAALLLAGPAYRLVRSEPQSTESPTPSDA
ncbi:VTT domain-containing protein [Halosolutus gelatinilyticus]|uniref:VTT domain-containing protein n=1 Tax=Halosolutus gelatinilyticus TaxID=2931975 RepID=UPI001FF1F998|nr:VTT domain-containing protein [Halosolutus gelatinilyticus]